MLRRTELVLVRVTSPDVNVDVDVDVDVCLLRCETKSTWKAFMNPNNDDDSGSELLLCRRIEIRKLLHQRNKNALVAAAARREHGWNINQSIYDIQ